MGLKTKRQLGQTDIEVTPIGLGLMQLAGGLGFLKFMFRELSIDTITQIIKNALDGGINLFDTAEIYGNGSSEKSLTIALKTIGKPKSEIVIATKWHPFLRTAADIKKTINTRLHCLDGYKIDLYQVHFPYSLSSIEEVINQMADLVAEGKIKSIGVSNYSAKQMRQAYEVLLERGLPLASNQVHYSLFNRKIEKNGILETAKELGISIIAYSPLESGLLTGKFHDSNDPFTNAPFFRKTRLRSQLEKSRGLIQKLKEIAQNYNATPAQVALNWLINFHGETILAIPGASTAEQAQANAATMNFSLLPEELTQIDKVSRKF
ncbi:MAG: aldo/keto reductase [Dehalococcoidia bacterium]|nr:MAG: aldo/keto reductase [Dehalococcoidia bacterium]